jgi:hypothetical protein
MDGAGLPQSEHATEHATFAKRISTVDYRQGLNAWSIQHSRSQFIHFVQSSNREPCAGTTINQIC